MGALDRVKLGLFNFSNADFSLVQYKIFISYYTFRSPINKKEESTKSVKKKKNKKEGTGEDSSCKRGNRCKKGSPPT